MTERAKRKRAKHSLYQSCMHHHTIRGLGNFLKGASERYLSRAVDGATDGVGAANLAHGNLETKVLVDVNHDLDLAAGLDALDGKLGNGLLGLPDNLANVLFLLLVRVEVRVLVVSGLLLRLGLGLSDLDVAGTLAHADQNITALLGGEVLSDAAGRQGSLGAEKGLEGDVGGRCELNANGLAQVGGHSDHGVDGLLDVFTVELLHQGSLEGGTTGSQLRGVDGRGRGRGGEDGGLLGEDVAGQLGDLGGVRSTAGEDDLDYELTSRSHGKL